MTNRRIKLFGVWALSIATLLFIASKLGDFSEWDLLLKHLNYSYRNPLLYITLLLPLLNFSIEALKWKILLAPKIEFSFKNALMAVVGGVTTGILTPARVGEIGARILLLKEESRKFGGAMFVVGSLIQSALTLLLGICALIWLKNGEWISSIMIYASILFVTIMLVYFIYLILNSFFANSSFFKLLTSYKKEILSCSYQKLYRASLFSFFKYAVYTIQLILVLYLFNPSISLISALPLVCLFYLGITFLPGFLLADLGIRGSLSLFLFSTIITSPPFILVPVFFLWILNSCLPAILGLWVIRAKTV